MFGLDQDSCELKKINQKIKEINKKDNAFRKTDKFKNLTEDEKREHDDMFYQFEIGELSAQAGELQTKIFLKEVRKYNLPIPKKWDEKTRDKFWDSNFNGEYRELSDQGYHELRNMLREEKKARREERILWWLPIISTFTGLVGASIGLFSILKQFLSKA